MGKKGNWFSSVKKALSPSSKEKKAKNLDKSKQKWPATEMPSASNNPIPEPIEVPNFPPFHPVENVNFTEVDDEETTRDYPVEVNDVTPEPPIVAPQAFVEVAQSSKVARFIGKSDEEVAAIKIQTTFRGYMARRALRALKGLVRLKTLVDGPTVKRQTANTMKCMQNLSRVHAQIQSRRMRMAEENRTLQRQLLQKRAKELESLKIGEEWDQSLQSKEQIEASLLQKYEAAMRRERALAYSYTHQQTWKKSARPMNLLFMDPTNPHWGWSWLERWMASTQPFEKTEKDLNSDSLSIKTAGVGEITKAYARHQLNAETPPSPARQKPASTRQSPATPKIASRKVNPLSPMGSMMSQDEDSRSMYSVVSEQNRRHTIGGASSVRDDESLASSPSVPSYMAPTRSAKGKMKLPSPLGAETSNGSEKGSTGPVKKRLSFPPSPGKPRRLSGPPRVETSTSVEHGGNGVLIS